MTSSSRSRTMRRRKLPARWRGAGWIAAALLATAALAPAASAAERPWPFNGRLTNAWDRPVEAWSDTRGAFIVDAGESTPTMEDVDYVNVGGQWYRIGVFHAYVMQDGSVSGFDCPSRSAGGPCD